MTLLKKIGFDACINQGLLVNYDCMSKTLPELHHQFFGSTFFVD